MHVRELVEIAALVAAHGPVIVEGHAQISSAGLEQYWSSSKCRLDRWLRSLKRLGRSAEEPASRERIETELKALLEEIIIAEIALRVWTAVLVAYDRRRRAGDAEPIARSVLVGHLDVRQRALALLIHSPHIGARAAVELNRLRRRAERWTDLLLGSLGLTEPPCELAFEAERCREFSSDLRRTGSKAGSRQAWQLTLASLRVAFQTGLADRSPNADLNHKIAGSILACFPPELFDSTGMMRSLWLVRLSHAADDAQGMLEQLLAVEATDERPGVPLPAKVGLPPSRRQF